MAQQTVDTGAAGRWQVDVDEDSHDEAANTSWVHVRGIVWSVGIGTSYANPVYWNVNIGGSVVASGSVAMSVVGGGASQTIIDQHFTVAHDASGNATATYTAHLSATGTNNIGGPADATASLVLPRLTHTPGAPTGYSARNITSSDAWTTGISVPDAGRGTLVDIQAECNTTQTDTGLYQAGTVADVHLTGLTRATTYYLRVRVANDTNGWGAWGGWVAFTTLPTEPDQPTAPTVSAIGPVSATVSFTLPNSGGSAITDTGFYLYAAPTGGSPVASDTSTSPIASWNFTGLTPGTTYYAAVWAINAVGWGAQSARTAFATLPAVTVGVGGVPRNGIPYVGVGDVWRMGLPYVGVAGVWRQ